jgi:Skp family chaperone for outer membrane proteins
MIELTKAQKEKILDEFRKDPSIINITRVVFENSELDGRSKEGRSVIKFLAENGLKIQTTKHEKAKEVNLNVDQVERVIEMAEDGMNTSEIADVLFNKRVKRLSNEWRAVNTILSQKEDDTQDIVQDSNDNYVAPQALSRIIKKINDSTGYGLEENRMSRNQKHCCDKLRINLNNSRFVAIVNNYTSPRDKELFEQEFIRLTWDKPDLTADELNLYMNVAKEIINLELITGHLQKLNDMFESADDQDEMTVRLAEIIKAKSSEYHQCESRIENLTKKLQGDRGQRLANKQKETASFLSIVQLFQEEEERKNMVRIAEMQKQIIKQEAEKLEGMSAWKARVLGISIEDVL